VTPDELRRTLDRLGVELSVTDGGLLRYRAEPGVLTQALVDTMRAHRDALVESLRGPPRTPADSASTDGGPSRHALSGTQTRIWLADRAAGGASELNIGGAIALRGRLDREALAAAVQATADRQAALRSSVVEEHGLPVLLVLPSVALPVRELAPQAGAGDRLIHQIVAEELARPFDVRVAPLCRIALVEAGSDRHVAVFALHHLIGDDHSVRVLGEEILDNYQQIVHTGRARQPPLSRPAHVILAERAAVRTDRLREQVRRRRNDLADAPAQALPAAEPSNGAPSAARTTVLSLDAGALDRWHEARRALRTTTLGLSLALVSVAVAAAGGDDDLLIGVPDYGREAPDEWRVIGCLFTALVVRLRPGSAQIFGELVDAAGRDIADAQAVRHVPYEDLVGSRARARLGGNILWVAPYAEGTLPTVANVTVEPLPVAVDAARHDLRIGVFVRPDELRVTLTARTGEVSAAFMTRLTDGLSTLVRDIPARDAPIDALMLRAATSPCAAHLRETTMTEQPDADLLTSIRARRRAAGRAPTSLVSITPPAGTWGAAVVTANLPGLQAKEWVDDHLDLVGDLVRRQSAVLLRHFSAQTADLGAVVAAVAGSALLDYINRSTPRERVAGRVFTSTAYPAAETIPLHSEQSYTTSWPSVIGFRCVRPAEVDGQTPLARNHDILAALPDDLTRRFVDGGLRYERWYQLDIDLPWQEVFQTGDPAEVDRFCAENGIERQWHDNGILHTAQTAQVIIERPAGRPVWFNQAHLFHPAALDPDVRAALTASTARPPRHVTYADGGEIADADIVAVTAAIERVAWQFTWQEGDLLLLDNEAVAHGRRPFRGERRVEVAMAGVGSA
jgi:hypothetical protein